jgi:uncharacterized RDD family membrane protein YckC
MKTQPNTGRRFGAFAIDYIIWSVPTIVFIDVYGVENEGGTKEVSGAMALIPLLFWLLWFVITESAFSRTFGKWVVGLRVRTVGGNDISFVQAFKRRLADIPEFFFFGILGFFLIKYTSRNQRLGDIWAKTIVVRDKVYECSNCREMVLLNSSEINTGQFDCPACGKRVRTNVVVSIA